MTITACLISAARSSVAARGTLQSIDWTGLPLTLRALGYEQSSEVASALSVAPADTESLVATRRILASIGDRAHAQGRATSVAAQAVSAMCLELVGLTGEALALLDAATQVCA